jgi:glycosyltransferase involved in cell wall biosynthesis
VSPLNRPRAPLTRGEPAIRVDFLARYTAGGSASMLRHLVEGLDRRQFEPRLIFHTIRDADYAQALEAGGTPVLALASPWPNRAPVLSGVNATARLAARPALREHYQTMRAAQQALALDLRWQPALARALRRRRPAVVHCINGLRAHRLDILLCASLGIPVICHMHGFERLSGLERLAARQVWRFIYISRAVATDFERQGLPASKGVVIPNALPAEALSWPAPIARRALGAGPEDFVAANVGRLVRWKGQDVFVRALALLAPRYPQLRGWLVGAADDNEASRAFEAELRALTAQLGLQDRVTFAGRRPDVLPVMAAADVVVHSATQPEPFGLVLLEAMAVGRPLVAAAAGGVLDVVTPEVNGLLAEPNNPEALAGSLERLLLDPALAARLGAAGRQKLETGFSMQDHVERVSALYRQCVAQQPQRTAQPVRPPAEDDELAVRTFEGRG